MERDSEVEPVVDMTAPGSETDQADGAASQIPYEDSLEGRVTDDVLDEGYSPPDYPPKIDVPTPAEQREGESLDQRLAAEAPEDDDDSVPRGPGDSTAGAERSGRLADTDDSDDTSDVVADDVGIAGGAASSEEAAMHTIDEEGGNG